MNFILLISGEFENALQSCSSALSIEVALNKVSENQNKPVPHMILGCLGVVNQYLGRYNAAVQSFEGALASLAATGKDTLPYVGFSMSGDDVMFNLLSSLNGDRSFERCVALGLQAMKLPRLLEGGGIVMTFSFVAWDSSEEVKEKLARVQAEETAAGRMVLNPDTTLQSEVLDMFNSFSK